MACPVCLAVGSPRYRITCCLKWPIADILSFIHSFIPHRLQSDREHLRYSPRQARLYYTMEINNDFYVTTLKTSSHLLEAAIALFESVLRSREHGHVKRQYRRHEAQNRKRTASSRRRPVLKPPAVVDPAAEDDGEPAGEVRARALAASTTPTTTAPPTATKR